MIQYIILPKNQEKTGIFLNSSRHFDTAIIQILFANNSY